MSGSREFSHYSEIVKKKQIFYLRVNELTQKFHNKNLKNAMNAHGRIHSLCVCQMSK